jgi:CSLREA domain-containing protein
MKGVWHEPAVPSNSHLDDGHPAGVPGVALAAPEDFSVNVVDDHDDSPCDMWTPETDCTLREAINASNVSAEAGTISLDIHDAPFGSVQTISPTSQLGSAVSAEYGKGETR